MTKQKNTAAILFTITLTVWLSACSSGPKKITAEEGAECMKFVFANNLNLLKEHPECLTYHGENGVTPLMMAASKGYLEIADYLLQKGVNVNSINNVQQSALHFAVVQRQQKMAELLVQNGAENRPNNVGITPLMIAVQLGSFELVEVLNPTFEDINIKADDGWTAIYFSIRKQDPKVLDFLLARGACVNFIDQYNQTPADFAKEVQWKYAQDKLKKGKVCKNH